MLLINRDCLEAMPLLKDNSVDLIIADLPYGTTANAWDSIIPFDLMWTELKRIIKPNGVVCLFGSEPFSSQLRISNFEQYKYDWYWLKNRPTGFTQAKNKPLKNLELISIFSSGTTVHASQSKNRMTYNPQGLLPYNKTVNNSDSKFGNLQGKRPSHKKTHFQEFTNYPKMTLEFDVVTGLHPTQKPVDLLEYLIATYSNEKETVLDFCMGSGSTGVAAKNLGRKFIGIERDDEYFEIAKTRLFKGGIGLGTQEEFNL